MGPSHRSAPLALAAALIPLSALARVGGGEHYTVGDDGDGGGGIPIELVFFLLRLTVEHPGIMCPLLTIVAVAIFLAKRKAGPGARTQRAFQHAEGARRTAAAAADVGALVTRLRARDPAFDPAAFDARTRRLFLEVQSAWFRRDLSPVRAFLSDATFQRLSTQLDLLRAQGVRDAIADVEVLDTALVAVDSGEWFDTAHVRIRARMRDQDAPIGVTDAEAESIARTAALEPFTEIWSFVRKPGAVTVIGQDVFQGKCPSCGAPYAGGATNKCEYCGAIVNSGNFDWTLAEITQAVEYVPHRIASVPGLDALRASDPGLNLEMLEDRTSLLFWRWIAARTGTNPSALAKLATPEMQERAAAGARATYRDCAVGAVIVGRIDPGAPGGRDAAHVEVRWSARASRSAPTVPARWVFTLVRRAGAKTRTDNGMATARCAQCGAPAGESPNPTCDYCGAALASGEHDWVLDAAVPIEAWRAAPERAVGAVPSDRVMDLDERRRLLYALVEVARADGVVDPREMRLLLMCADRWGVEWSLVERALETDLRDEGVPRVQPGSREAEELLGELVQMALVDGEVDRRERALLESAARHLRAEAALGRLIPK